MQNVEISALEEEMKKFNTATTDLKKTLDYLTTDGAGILYELKTLVGANTTLGNAISTVGGEVMRAKNHAITNLNNLYTFVVDGYINPTKANQQTYVTEANKAVQKIESISWE